MQEKSFRSPNNPLTRWPYYQTRQVNTFPIRFEMPTGNLPVDLLKYRVEFLGENTYAGHAANKDETVRAPGLVAVQIFRLTPNGTRPVRKHPIRTAPTDALH